MIRFLTLLLGLVWGPHEIELSVDPKVAAVRCELDGEQVTLLEEAPWKFTVDLGRSPMPQRLEVVALDGDGRELERATQLLNVPRAKSDVALDLQLDPTGRRSTAQIVWKSVLDDWPDAIQVRLNDQLLATNGTPVIELPAYDPQQLQFLQVQVTFAGSSTASAEATFGGSYADRVRTELTAVPLLLTEDPGVRLLPTWPLRFQRRGVRIDPDTIEKGNADLVFVRDIDAWTGLRSLPRRSSAIPEGNVVLVDSVPLVRDGVGGRSLLFPVIFDAPFRHRQLRFLIDPLKALGWRKPKLYEEPQQLHRAVAVAAQRAAERNHRRVLVVILGAPGAELLNPEATKRTLRLAEQLGVPVRIWTTHPRRWEKVDAEEHGWGEIVSIMSQKSREQAIADLADLVARQRIAWFEGTHLVKEFTLEENPEASILE